jgi:hypothetical protein
MKKHDKDNNRVEEGEDEKKMNMVLDVFWTESDYMH